MIPPRAKRTEQAKTMFQFSRLLSKSASRVRPDDGLEHCESPDAEPAVQASDCVSERVRRDLDEQMARLQQLLDRVESLEFEQAAASADLFSTQPEVSPTEPQPASAHDPTASEAARQVSQAPGITCDAAAVPNWGGMDQAATQPQLSACEIVLGGGVRARLDQLPAMKDTADQRARVTPPERYLDAELVTDAPEPAPQRPVRPASGSGVVLDFPVQRTADAETMSVDRVESEFGPLHLDDSEQAATGCSPDAVLAPMPEPSGEQLGPPLEPAGVPPVLAGNAGGGAATHTATETAVASLVDCVNAECGYDPVRVLLVDQTTERPPELPVATGVPAALPDYGTECSTQQMPRIRLRRSPVTPVAEDRIASAADNSAALTILATCGGLLTLAALLYVIGDLLNLFR
jgi:hypothetical protein